MTDILNYIMIDANIMKISKEIPWAPAKKQQDIV